MWTAQWFAKKGQQPKPLKEILESMDREKKQMTDEQMLAVVQKLNTMFGGEVRVIGKE